MTEVSQFSTVLAKPKSKMDGRDVLEDIPYKWKNLAWWNSKKSRSNKSKKSTEESNTISYV